MQTTVFLLRHAAYENPQKIFHGRSPGFPLSEEGRRQAKRLADYLSNKPIVAVYASPLTRAYQTAEIVASAQRLSVITDERVIDVKTPLEGVPVSYIDQINGNFYTRDLIARGGERLSEVFGRVDDFIKEKVKEHQGAVLCGSFSRRHDYVSESQIPRRPADSRRHPPRLCPHGRRAGDCV